jgi:integrase
MPRKRIPNFTFNSVTINGHQYYKAYVMNADHKLVIVYGKTIEELCQKYDEAEHRTENDLFSKRSPTVKEYCEKWLLMQSANVRATTLIDYTSKVNRHIIAPLGHMKMAEVTADDIKMALVPVSKKSASVYKSINIILKCIFNSAEDSKIITYNPTRFLSSKNGGVPQKDKEALTDAQVELLLDTIRDLPPYVFVMLGLYAGLRREEILALKWDCVDLNADAPYVMVRRAWHTESNRPIILTDLKTKAARRDIAIPNRLAECLREAKEKSSSDFVIANSDGGPLSYSQFKNLWRFIVVRTAKPRPAKKKVGGKYVKYTLYPQLGEMAKNNGKVQYVLDFEVKPHQLRHTYITNLIAAGVDPKTVQYLAGHESSKITMDIYAKVKYNRPEEVAKALDGAFAQWKEQTVQ